jgi:hypothetical protein
MRGLKRELALTLAAATAVLAALALVVGPAWAGEPVFLKSFEGSATKATEFGESESLKVAVDEASGDVYVLDAVHEVVDKFDAEGKTLLGEITPTAGSFGFKGKFDDIAVDNSGGAGQGDLYVFSRGEFKVFAFDSSGAERWSAADPGSSAGLGVDAGGNPWVADVSSESAVQLSPSDGKATGTKIAFGERYTHIAFDSEGSIYAEGVSSLLTKFETGGASTAFDSNVNDSYSAVSASLLRKDVFTVSSDVGIPTLNDWTSSGTQLAGITGSGTSDNFTGVAVDGQRDRLYVADSAAKGVRVYAIASEPPAIVSVAATEVSTSAATLHATIEPNGGEVTDCHAEVVSNASFVLSEWATATSYPCLPSAPISGSSKDVEVTAAVTGLSANTTYHTRFVATNAGGTAEGADVLVKTLVQLAPEAVTGAASGVGQSTATLGGTVNPEGAETTCLFEYGTSTSYGSSVPCSAAAGSGSSAVAVGASLSGLAAGTTYHFRVVATNSGGTMSGADATFTTTAAPVEKTTPPAEKTTPPAEKMTPPVEKTEKHVVKKLTRGQLLAAAIKKCHKLPRRKRAACIKKAKKKYAPPKKHKK